MAKDNLPPDFLWGFATASYQIEGAITEDGRGPSIWDTFCAKPGKIADGTSGEIACDSYHRIYDDIALLKQCGAKVYRFSLSWSRIIPLGGRKDPVNEKGLRYYLELVDGLHEAGIVPMVTLLHWDLPDALYQRYDGYMNKDEFVADYANYARVVFDAFGSKVKHWITFNEPWCSSILGYSTGSFAPGRTSNRKKNPEGDSSTEPWIVGHHLLIAHSHAVKIYREEFKERDGGEIGITLNGDWAEPWDPNDPKDIEAAIRRVEFFTCWFGDPIYHGDYPASMRAQLGDRLPKFTDAEIALIKGSNDFYGMNHYCTTYAKHRDTPAPLDDFSGNMEIPQQNRAGDWIGPETQSDWLRPNPMGFRKLLKFLSDRYGRPKIYVTENGTSIKGENDLPLEKMLDDEFRCEFFRGYVKAMRDAYVEDDVDVRVYTAWSLMDNFEWAEGYETRFGCSFVDYEHGQKRYPKKSAKEIGQIFDKYIQKA